MQPANPGVLHVALYVHEVLFGLHVLHAPIPVVGFLHLALEVNHLQCLAQFRVARTNVHAVPAAETVHHADLHTEVHTFHCCRGLHLAGRALEALDLLLVHDERTDAGVRTYIRALVTFDTVLRVPYRHESRHAAFLKFRCTRLPNAVLDALERADRQQVAVLCVDGASLNNR